MRVLMLSPEYPPVVVGGIATHTAHLVAALAAEGACEVTLLTSRGARDLAAEQRDGAITVLRPPIDLRTRSPAARMLRENIAWSKCAVELCRRVAFDVIHCQGWIPGLAAAHLAALTDLPLVTTFHSTERAVLKHRWNLPEADPESNGIVWEDELLHLSRQIIAVSQALADEVRSLYRCKRPLTVVHNGITAPGPTPAPREPRAVRRLLFVGRVMPHKGLEWMIEGLALARELPFELEIIGRDWGVPGFQAHLIELAGRLGIGERVRFVGFVAPEALADRYRDADAVLVPSLYEPFGLVCLEAMRHGVPLVASRCGGIVEIADDDTAELVEPGNAPALAAAVQRVFAQPAETALRVARAREVAATRFCWDRIARDTLEVYRRACVR